MRRPISPQSIKSSGTAPFFSVRDGRSLRPAFLLGARRKPFRRFGITPPNPHPPHSARLQKNQLGSRYPRGKLNRMANCLHRRKTPRPLLILRRRGVRFFYSSFAVTAIESSSRLFCSTSAGHPVISSLAFWTFGKAITSRIESFSKSSITSRSRP